MKSWPKVKLGEACAINPKVAPPSPEQLISVVPMSAVSESGEIDASDVRPFADVAKGLTLFQEGDVLFAKITPCMENGKGAVAVGLRGGVGAGSTEFFVLRPDGERALSAWIYHFTKRAAFRRSAAERMTGSAGQRRVPRAFLERVALPLPSLDEQARIVAELDAVAATLRKRQTQLAELDALVQARFVELFGGGRFPTVAIGDEFKTTSGGTPSSKTREYYDGGAIPWLNSGEVNRGVVDYAENFITELGLKNSSAKWVPVDSVLVAMYGATVGKVGLLRIPATTNQAVCSILPNPQFCPRYLYFAVKSQESWMRSQALGGAQPNISQTVVKKMTIPKPPLALQERFAAEVERVEALKTTVRAGIAETRTLFDALSQRYFG